MNPTTQGSRLSKLLHRMGQSRHFTISLLLHVGVLVVAGTIALVQQPPASFEPTGHVASINAIDVVPAPSNTEQPLEYDPTHQPVEVIPQPQPASPPGAGKLPVIAVSSPGVMPVGIIGGIPGENVTTSVPVTRMTHGVPIEMSDRFGQGPDGRINSRNWAPGRPRPSMESENAVIKGLGWLRDHQNADGSWGERNQGAMTGLALLCLLGHGETGDSANFGFCVQKAVTWMLTEGQRSEGRLSMTAGGWGSGNSGVYEHAIATYALGEYYSMTKDDRVADLLRKAVGYVVAGQGPDGGWMYGYDKSQGDTSVSGWQVQALKAAHLTGLNIAGVDAALNQSMKNFDRVQGPKGGYGYRGAEDRYSLTGVGVLCELFWTGRRGKDLQRAITFIHDVSDREQPVLYQSDSGDLYAWYYHTQAMLMYGGAAWSNWEKKFSKEIIKAQTSEGNWPPMRAAGHGNLQNAQNLTGDVYRTTLCVLMLEVYYRYLPVHRSEAASPVRKLAMR